LGLVFTHEDGRPISPQYLTRSHFPALARWLHLPEMDFHDLRHTAATLLLARGVNVKVVSEMLGHANVTITLQIYAHVLPHMQQSAVEVMDGIFGGDTESGA
jgi:integrase